MPAGMVFLIRTISRMMVSLALDADAVPPFARAGAGVIHKLKMMKRGSYPPMCRVWPSFLTNDQERTSRSLTGLIQYDGQAHSFPLRRQLAWSAAMICPSGIPRRTMKCPPEVKCPLEPVFTTVARRLGGLFPAIRDSATAPSAGPPTAKSAALRLQRGPCRS